MGVSQCSWGLLTTIGEQLKKKKKKVAEGFFLVRKENLFE